VQDDLDLKIEAHPKALTIEPEPFPYPLACDGGTLVFEKDRIVFDDVRGGAGDMNLRMRGYLGIQGDAPPLELTIEAHDVALDDLLLAAVRKLPDPRLAQAFEQLKPTGHVDLHVIWKRAAAGAPTELTIEVAPNDVRLEGFGGKIVVTGLRGTVAIHRSGDGPWELTASGTGLSARAFGGGVSLSGRMTEGGAAGAAESPASLRLVGRRLRLDPESIAAVRCIAPDVATLFEAYHLRGRASVERSRAATGDRGALTSSPTAPVGARPWRADAVGRGRLRPVSRPWPKPARRSRGSSTPAPSSSTGSKAASAARRCARAAASSRSTRTASTSRWRCSPTASPSPRRPSSCSAPRSGRRRGRRSPRGARSAARASTPTA
jgi:hypothetical protein